MPSPPPWAIPIAANSVAYSVRLTSEPSQSSHPAGGTEPAKATTIPAGVSPATPCEPVAPVGPVGPSRPVRPVAPAGPDGPEGPEGPDGPSDPVGPALPEQPARSTARTAVNLTLCMSSP